MRYLACEKLEIIQLVEQSHLPVRRTLEKLGIPRATFYRWYDLYRTGGPDALGDRSPRPDRVWNQIPDNVAGYSEICYSAKMALWACSRTRSKKTAPRRYWSTG
jgi:transposase-like protein